MKQTTAFIAIFSVAVLILSSVVITSDDNENYNSTAMCFNELDSIPEVKELVEEQQYELYGREIVHSSKFALDMLNSNVGEYVEVYTCSLVREEDGAILIAAVLYDADTHVYIGTDSGEIPDFVLTDGGHSGLGSCSGSISDFFGNVTNLAFRYGQEFIEGLTALGEMILKGLIDLGATIWNTLVEISEEIKEAVKLIQESYADLYYKIEQMAYDAIVTISEGFNKYIYQPLYNFITEDLLDMLYSIRDVWNNLTFLEDVLKNSYDVLIKDGAGKVLKEKIGKLMGEELYNRIVEFAEKFLTSAYLPPIIKIVQLAMAIIDFTLTVKEIAEDVWNFLKEHGVLDPPYRVPIDL